MYNIFNQVLDQIDESITNTKLASDIDNIPTKDEDYALILKQGDAVARKYPIDTVENSIYSYVAFLKNRNKLTDNMDKVASSHLSRILDFFGVEHILEDDPTVKNNIYEIKQSDIAKLAAVPEPKREFAILSKDKGYLPLDTKQDFRASLKEFKHELPVLPAKLKKIASKKFLEKSKDFNLNLDELRKYASFDLASKDAMQAAVATRLMSYPKYAQDLVYEVINQIKTAEDALNAIEVVNEIDKEVGIVPNKHFDLAEKFFSIPNEPTRNLNDKIQDAINDNKLDSYLDKEVIDLLKTGGEETYNNLNPRLKSVILNII